MKISHLSVYLQKLDKTSSRLEITSILASLFKETQADEIAKVCYLILGSLAPTYKNIVFNIAEQLILQAISKAYNSDLNEVKKRYKEIGDVGETVYGFSIRISDSQSVANGYRQKISLSVLDVYDRLFEIANEQGDESVDRKITKTSDLLKSIDPLSAKYISRIILGKLRLGFSDKTIIDAFSWMETNSKSKSKSIEEAYNVLPDVGLLAEKIKKSGIDMAVMNITPIVGIPVMPALAQRLKSPKEMIEKMKEVGIEPKFDGLRIQIHYKKNPFYAEASKGKQNCNSKIKDLKIKETNLPSNELTKHTVFAFTRNMNETSWMFPELKNIGDYLSANEVILDSEAIGIDEKRKTLLNFQLTMTRRRKYEIEEISKKVGIKFYVFDILSKDGKSLIRENYIKRKKILSMTVKNGGPLECVNGIITDNPLVIEQEMKKKLGSGLEGILVKRTDGGYVSGRTGWHWVKMKQEEGEKSKLADTIDCVVMGYYKGKGKRAGFGIGGFLVGILDKEKDKDKVRIQTLTKIGTGLTDEQFRDMKKRLEKLKCSQKPEGYREVNKLHTPDVWVEPELVVEIAADEITKSPSHSSGYALRFPRLVRIRDDKSMNQATSIEEIEEMMGR